MGVRNGDRCSKVLRFLEAYVQDNGYPPTYDEIRESVGLSSKSHVLYYLSALEGQGVIERTPRAPRSLRLVGMAGDTFEVEAAGQAAASRSVPTRGRSAPARRRPRLRFRVVS